MTKTAALAFVCGIALWLPASAAADTQTWSNTSSITINTAASSGSATAATPYPSTIAVSGMVGGITKVTVTLSNINHTSPDDIDVALFGPQGQSLMLTSDSGGATPYTNTTFTFDDAAASNVPDAAAASGTYKPTDWDGGAICTGGSEDLAFPSPIPSTPDCGTLAVFNATNPNGTWSLYVVDDAGGDSGTISGGWSLTITSDAATAVQVATFSAVQRPQGVLLRWTAGSEARVAGYNVWRVGHGQPAERVNPKLVAARSTVAGRKYRVVDQKWCTEAAALTYRLQAVYLDGSRRWVATTRVRA